MNRFVSNFLRFLISYQNWVVFIFTVSFFIIYGYLFSPNVFYFDSNNYWALRGSFFSAQGGFSILNYTDSLRGYLFPLILLIVDMISPDQLISIYMTVVVFNSIIMAVISVVLLPAITSSVSSFKFTWYQKISIVLLVFIFWRGYIFYPLSDFPAFLFLLIALYFFVVINEFDNALFILLKSLLAGLFVGVAYCIRPIYLISIIVLTFGIVYKTALIYIATKRFQKLVVGLTSFLLGIAFIFAPQYQINRFNLSVNSVVISHGLYSSQVTGGFRVQKAEGNVNTNILNLNYVTYLDPQANNILMRQSNLNHPINIIDVKTFLKLLKKYPLDVLTIYFRHLFNGLNITYHTVYIYNMYKLDTFAMILNYSVIFSTLFLFRVRNIQIHNSDLLLATLTLIMPVLAALPGAVEVRFFLPLHLINYSIFALFIGEMGEVWQDLSKDRATLARTVIFYVIFIIASLSFSAMIATTIPNSRMLLSR